MPTGINGLGVGVRGGEHRYSGICAAVLERRHSRNDGNKDLCGIAFTRYEGDDIFSSPGLFCGERRISYQNAKHRTKSANKSAIRHNLSGKTHNACARICGRQRLWRDASGAGKAKTRPGIIFSGLRVQIAWSTDVLGMPPPLGLYARAAFGRMW